MGLGALLFSFRGRINRVQFWQAALIYVVLYAVIITIGIVTGQITLQSVVPQIFFLIYFRLMMGFGLFVGSGSGFQSVITIIQLVMLISVLSVGAKRLHDRNKSAWWLLVFYSVSVMAAIEGVFIVVNVNALPLMLPLMFSPIVHYLSWIIMLALQAWYFVELGCLPGTDGPNRYGPDSLASAGLPVQA
jgi:uncharacterized membrane protein YhaH (DUF805 family)